MQKYCKTHVQNLTYYKFKRDVFKKNYLKYALFTKSKEILNFVFKQIFRWKQVNSGYKSSSCRESLLSFFLFVTPNNVFSNIVIFQSNLNKPFSKLFFKQIL